MECQVQKLEHFRHILLLVSNRGAKAARYICAVYGDNTIGESKATKWFYLLRIIFLWRSFKHINPQWSTSAYLITGKCDIPPSCDICVQKSGVWVPHALSQNHTSQWVVIRASLLARHRLACEQHRQFLSCIVTGDEKRRLYANIRKKGMIEPKQKINSPYKDLRASTKDYVMDLMEQRECAIVRIVSPRCNHHCRHLLPTTETSCRHNPRKTTNRTITVRNYTPT